VVAPGVATAPLLIGSDRLGSSTRGKNCVDIQLLTIEDVHRAPLVLALDLNEAGTRTRSRAATSSSTN
jgi:hypothetical protein